MEEIDEITPEPTAQPKRRGRRKKVVQDGFEEMEQVTTETGKPKTTRTRRAKGGSTVSSILVPFLILLFWLMSMFTHPAFQMSESEAKNIANPLGNIIANIPWLYQFFIRYGTNSSDYVALFFAIIAYWQGVTYRMQMMKGETSGEKEYNPPNTGYESDDAFTSDGDDEQPPPTGITNLKRIGRGD